MNIELIVNHLLSEKCLARGYPRIPILFKTLKKGTNGLYNNGIIYIDLNNSVDKIIFTIFHECEHYFQDYDLNNNIVNVNSIAMVIRKIFNNTYLKEYSKVDIERLANIQANFDILSYNTSSRYKKITNNYHFPEYTLTALISIIKKQPYLLKQYPILIEFFNKDGSLKNIDTLLKQYKNIKKDFSKHHHINTDILIEDKQYVYKEIFNYIINKYSNKHRNVKILKKIINYK